MRLLWRWKGALVTPVEYVTDKRGNPILDRSGKPIPKYANPDGLGAKADRFISESVRDFGRSALDAFNLGFTPQLEGAGEAALNVIGQGRKGETAAQAYERRKKEITEERAAREKRSPVAGMLGSTAGGIGSAMIVPEAPVEKVISKTISKLNGKGAGTDALAKAIANTSLAGVQSALAGLGYGQPKNWDEAWEIIQTAGGLGALLGAGMTGVAHIS